jgi:hypothetical protein
MKKNNKDTLFPELGHDEIREQLMALCNDDIITTESTGSAIRIMDDVFNEPTDVVMSVIATGNISLTWFADDEVNFIICGKSTFDCYHISGDESYIRRDVELGEAEEFLFKHVS